MPYDVIVTVTGDIVGQFASGKEANTFVKELKGQGNAGPFRIIFKEDAEPAWHKRERDRFANGAYEPLPEWLTSADWYAKFAPPYHYTHPSTNDVANKIAFTPTPEMGAADKQRAMRVGAYFEMFFNSNAVVEAGRPPISKLVSLWRAHYTGLDLSFDITYSGSKIADIYTLAKNVSPNGEDGCSSCMSGDNYDEGGWPDGIHPAYVYGIDAPPGHPDHDKALALIYATDEHNEYVGRVVVWPAKKVHSTIYANNEDIYEQFVAYLDSEGYERGSFEGAYIRRVPLEIESVDEEEVNDSYDMGRVVFTGGPTVADIFSLFGFQQFSYNAVGKHLLRQATDLLRNAQVMPQAAFLCPFIDRFRGDCYYLIPADETKFTLTAAYNPSTALQTTNTCGYTESEATYAIDNGRTVTSLRDLCIYRRANNTLALANRTAQNFEEFTSVIDYDPDKWPVCFSIYMRNEDLHTIEGRPIKFLSGNSPPGLITPSALEQFKKYTYNCPLAEYLNIPSLYLFDCDEQTLENWSHDDQYKRHIIVGPNNVISTLLSARQVQMLLRKHAPNEFFGSRHNIFIHKSAHPMLTSAIKWRANEITTAEFKQQYPTILSSSYLPRNREYFELPSKEYKTLLQECSVDQSDRLTALTEGMWAPTLELMRGESE